MPGEGGWTDLPPEQWPGYVDPATLEYDRAKLAEAHKHISCVNPEAGGPHWPRVGPACGWVCAACGWVCSASAEHGYGPRGKPQAALEVET